MYQVYLEISLGALILFSSLRLNTHLCQCIFIFIFFKCRSSCVSNSNCVWAINSKCSLFSSAQCLFSRSHPPGAVLAGQWGRYEHGCLWPQQVQWREGWADLPDVGLWKRSFCVMMSTAVGRNLMKTYTDVIFLPQDMMLLSHCWSTTNVLMIPPAMSTPSQEEVRPLSENFNVI